MDLAEVGRDGVMHSATPPSQPTAEAQRNSATLRQFETHLSKSCRMNVLSARAINKKQRKPHSNGHFGERSLTSPLC